jgi:hypothetical protein
MSSLFPDPNSPPNRMDCLAHGEDCARHPLIGCIISNNGTPASAQARSYLLSLYHATEQRVAGRGGDFTAVEYREWLRKLEVWEAAGNVVPLPPPIVGHPFTGAPRPAPRVDHVAEQAKLIAAATAMAERAGGTTH